MPRVPRRLGPGTPFRIEVTHDDAALAASDNALVYCVECWQREFDEEDAGFSLARSELESRLCHESTFSTGNTRGCAGTTVCVCVDAFP